MAELKTQVNDTDPITYLEKISDSQKRQDSFALLKLMQESTGAEPKMWGDSTIGFGSYHFRYASGKEGDWFLVGFKPRMSNFTLYIMSGFDRYDELLGKLGKHRTAKSCLYIKKLEDVDLDILSQIVKLAAEYMAEIHK